MATATLTADRVWDAEHRGINVSRVENGYQVVAQMIVNCKDYQGEKRDQWKKRTYVFQEIDEVLDFVGQYLKAGPKELRGEEKVGEDTDLF